MTSTESAGDKVIAPPIAERRPHDVIFGAVEGENRGGKPFAAQRTRNDDWFWLRDDDRKDDKVLEHLRLENEYCKQQLSHLDGMRKESYDEHISHLKETDDRAPHRHGPFFQYTRTV